MRFARVPVVGWLVGVIVLLGLLAWNLLRSLRIAHQRLVVEKNIRDLSVSYRLKRAKFSKTSKEKIGVINAKAAKKMTALEEKKRLNIESARTLRSTSELANRVFGDPDAQ
jgi:hypothetical protein